MATLDNQLLETVLEDSFDPLTMAGEQLRQGLRRLTLAGEATPVLCGSALKNTGVQPLLDAVAHYLPAPTEKKINM